MTFKAARITFETRRSDDQLKVHRERISNKFKRVKRIVSSPCVVKNNNKLLIHTLEKGKIRLWRRENKGRSVKYRTFHTHTHILWYAGHRRPLSSRRRRELAYHNLRMAYMSLTKNTILVRSRLLYVYHRRPAHHRIAASSR